MRLSFTTYLQQISEKCIEVAVAGAEEKSCAKYERKSLIIHLLWNFFLCAVAD